DLIEVSADRRRRDVVPGLAGGGARSFIDDVVIDGHDLAELDVDRGLLGSKTPRESTPDIGIEPNSDGAVVERRSRRVVGHLRRSTEAGGATEPGVKRDGDV